VHEATGHFSTLRALMSALAARAPGLRLLRRAPSTAADSGSQPSPQTKPASKQKLSAREVARSDDERPAGAPNCRFCGSASMHTLIDLGMSPLCQRHIKPDQLDRMEPFFPLHAFICDRCFLVQLDQAATPGELFEEYAYFSSYSDSWVENARQYVEAVSARFGLGKNSFVVEIASNDGYLLQHFVKSGVPVLGIEPAANVAKVAVEKGVRSEVAFFGSETAAEVAAHYGRPTLIIGNNVLAHTPYLNDFVRGLRVLLAPTGVVTMEFPHLLRLIQENQYDTIYHEHFSYFSFTTVEKVFAAQGLTMFDVEQVPTHGGSLRIYARHAEDWSKPVGPPVAALKAEEAEYGLGRLETYADFGARVNETKRALLEFLIAQKRAGKTIAGYGAPGKGNTLLNYCGIRGDFLSYTVDRNPYTQGKYTPGTRIPIFSPEKIEETKPDFLLILPWNLKEEIVAQTAYIRAWGGKWVVPIPELKVID
jgi:hypothetical protein